MLSLQSLSISMQSLNIIQQTLNMSRQSLNLILQTSERRLGTKIYNNRFSAFSFSVNIKGLF